MNSTAITVDSRPLAMVMALLLIATVLAYQPAWRGQPIWDDAAHLTPPSRRSLAGLLHTWTDPGTTQQYYPLVHSVFWVEDKLWGDATLGYHLVNILLHVTAAGLLLLILRTLQIPAAELAAAIFALHPVEVESVAWMTELKNTLSAVFYFGSALAYLRFDRSRSKGAYAGALMLFVLGLLAKTAIVTLPAALLVVFWWQRGKLSWKNDVLRLLPFFAVGITSGLFTSWMERRVIGAEGAEFNFSHIERFLIAGHAVWFYLGKLFWPADLIFCYPRWKVSPTIGWQFLYPAAMAALMGALWVLRRRARGPLAALLFFIGTLFPVLGFFNVFLFRYTFVADHFQYIASAGPIVAASMGLHALFGGFRKWRLFWERTFCALLLAVLGLLTWRQSRMYTDIETLWTTTIARNPQCWLAEDDLGAVLYEKGQVDQAIMHFRSSLAIRPDNGEAENNLGAALAKKGQVDEAIVRFRKAVAIRPDFAEAYRNLGNTLLRKGQVDEAILQCQKAASLRPDLAQVHYTLASALLQKGQRDQAILEFQKTLEIDPDDYLLHYNFGIALRQMGKSDEAVVEFQKSTDLRPYFAEAQNNLGNGLLQQGRVDDAIAHLRKALAIHPDYAPALYNLGNALLQSGQVAEAIREFQALLAVQPDSVEARKSIASIAWRMATSPNPAQRNGAKAVELARQTDQLAGGSNPMMAAILAAACAETGQFEQAVATARRALQLTGEQGNGGMTAAIQAQLKCYEAGTPFRDAGGSP